MLYTFSLSRRSLPVRCLCLLLIVLVLWCFFMVPRAGAVALEATTIAYGGLLVGTILVGAGVVFSSHGDMVKVGNAMYKTLVNGSSAIGKTISSISAWAVEHGTSLAKGALRVGKDMYQAIVDAFNASYSNGRFKVPAGASTFYLPPDATSDAISAVQAAFNNKYINDICISIDGISGVEHYYRYYFKISDDLIEYGHDLVDSDGRSFSRIGSHSFNPGALQDASIKVKCYDNGDIDLEGYAHFGDYDKYLGVADFVSKGRGLWISTIPFFIPVPHPDLKYPSDDYLVKMPDIPSVDTATGDVTYPNDTAYTKDAVAVPYPVDTEGVKVPDIPYDKVVDQSTGKSLDDTGTDTENPSKPGEGTNTGSNTSLLQKILDLLKNFFDSPSDFRLNMDGFRNLAIKDKFPFCIPFDMVDSVKQFAADAADYQFRVKLDTQYFKVDHVVDLTPLAVPLAFFRYLVVAWFAWVLMSRTHDLMKW